ncbi:nucleophosmin-like isoform X2 [Rhinatrema bivittatum]|uniref:nucleophosmin-like isoform X2 n=1 Tax=Rhinatrema bivittatum TaxID=194408 RepID=UPI00112DD50A|nr:nucleophosmin-like isoform X2 [Rhinatrema bivittatum]
MAEDPGRREAHVSIFGCQLTSDKTEYHFKGDDDSTTQQLVLQTVCLGADANDELHRVEVEAVNSEGKPTKVQLVALRSSILTMVSLAGFAITPPVSFRLKSGSGPIYISGHHFISQEDSEDEEEEEEHNTSPIKRPSKNQAPQGRLHPSPKKLKFEEDDEDESDEYEDEEDDEEEERKPAKVPNKAVKETQLTKSKSSHNENSASEKLLLTSIKAKSKTSDLDKKPKEKGKTPSEPKPPPTLSEIKVRLKSMSDKGLPLPKTEQKFENFVKSSFKLQDKKAAKDLWAFTQSLKGDK